MHTPLIEVLQRLWPGAEVRTRTWSGPTSAPAPDRPEMRWILLRGRSGARMLLPASLPLARAALRGFSAAGPAERVRTAATAGLLATGTPLPARMGLTVRQPAECASIEQHLTQVLSQTVRVAVWIGARHARTRFVLQVLDAGADTVGFARVGTTPRAHELLRTEARALAVLGDVAPGNVLAPRSLYHGYWQGLGLLVQTPLLPTTWHPGDAPLLTQAMRSVSRLGGVQLEALATSRYLQRLLARLDRLPRDENSAVLHRAIGNLAHSCGPNRWPFGSWHGDWTGEKSLPAGGRLAVMDWQHFESSTPIGYDAVHFALHQLLAQPRRRAGAAEAVVSRAGSVLAGWGIEDSQAADVVTAYLVDITARYLEEEQAGEVAGPRLHTWLLPSIAKEAQRLAGGGTRHAHL